MAETGEQMNKYTKKSSDVVSCKYRGHAIECPKADFRAEICERCGWNPMIEADRKAKLKK